MAFSRSVSTEGFRRNDFNHRVTSSGLKVSTEDFAIATTFHLIETVDIIWQEVDDLSGGCPPHCFAAQTQRLEAQSFGMAIKKSSTHF